MRVKSGAFAASKLRHIWIVLENGLAPLANSLRRVQPEIAAGPVIPNQVLAIVCLGIVLANLDLFIVNVALPDISRNFAGGSLARLSWILNGYAIVYAALLVFLGRLAERHRRDRSFLLGVGLFTLASAACAAATSIEMLITFRLVQAAGAALMTPTSVGLLLATFPPERRGQAVRFGPRSAASRQRSARSWVASSSRGAGAGYSSSIRQSVCWPSLSASGSCPL